MSGAMSIYEFSARTIDGQEQSLADYRGRTLLIVNVASRCGFTPQYRALEALYRRYRDRGFSVLGFPCNQFGHQEPGSEAQIRAFCSASYDVSFPLFAKIEVNGRGAHPLYRHLRRRLPGAWGKLGLDRIQWNFTKFLISPAGEPLRRFGSAIPPERIAPEIEAHLPAPAGRP
jgi:glutathione peroxidase